MAITFPRVFANLTLAQLSYLDENFAAINAAINAINGIAGLDATGKLLPAVIPPTSNNVAFGVYLSANQSLSSGVITRINFDTKAFDTNTNYNTATQRFTPTVAGKYLFSINIITVTGGFTNTSYARLFKNGLAFVGGDSYFAAATSNTGTGSVAYSVLVDMNGSTDYIELWCNIIASVSVTVIGGTGVLASYWSGVRVS